MLNIDIREVLRYLGYRGIRETDPGLDALIQSCMTDVQKACSPRSVYRSFPLEKVTEDECVFAGLQVRSRNLARNLRGCTEAVMMAVTIGPGTDQLIRRAELTNVLQAYVYQAAGAAACEALAEEVDQTIRQEALSRGLYARPRFSPGYGDLSLEMQLDFERILQMRKIAGISLNESLLMTPTKSVTAIIGLSPEPRECHRAGCEECTLAGNCPYSRV